MSPRRGAVWEAQWLGGKKGRFGGAGPRTVWELGTRPDSPTLGLKSCMSLLVPATSLLPLPCVSWRP